MAEQVVLEEGAARLEAVIVRPRFVWGRGDTTLLPVLVEGTRSGAFRWVGGGRHLTSTTHIDNTVEGLLCAAEHGRGGRAYFVTDGDPLPFRDFVGELIATQGVTPPTGSVPAPVAPGARRARRDGVEAAAAARPPPLTRFAAWVSSLECTIDDTRARTSSATRRSSRASRACASCATLCSPSVRNGRWTVIAAPKRPMNWVVDGRRTRAR